MHPNLSELYRTRVANLQEALTTHSDNAEVIERLRDLIDRVDVGAAAGNDDAAGNDGADGADSDMPAIVLTGAIGAMLRLTMSPPAAIAASGHGLFLSSVKVVAGARFERAAFRL